MLTDFSSMPPEAAAEAMKMEIAKYDTSPLPIGHVDGIEDLTVTWQDFDQDDTGDSVFLYRGIQGPDNDEEKSHLPREMYWNTDRQIDFSDPNATKDLARIDSEFNSSPSGLTLHTSRRKNISKGFATNYGMLMTYKIPKSWVVQNTDKIFLGNVGEEEIDIVGGIPKEFVSGIDKFDNLPASFGDLPRQINIPAGVTGSTVETPASDLHGQELPPPPTEDLTII